MILEGKIQDGKTVSAILGLSGAADEKRTREILRQGIASKIKWKIVGIIFRMFHKMYRYPREGRVL